MIIWKILTHIDLRSNELTHCGLVTPHDDRDLGQHWLRLWLVAWRHQAITWTNADLSSVRSSDIHLRTISQGIPRPTITKISFKIIYLKLHSNLPGTNELMMNIIVMLSLCHEPLAIVNRIAPVKLQPLGGIFTTLALAYKWLMGFPVGGIQGLCICWYMFCICLMLASTQKAWIYLSELYEYMFIRPSKELHLNLIMSLHCGYWWPGVLSIMAPAAIMLTNAHLP